MRENESFSGIAGGASKGAHLDGSGAEFAPRIGQEQVREALDTFSRYRRAKLPLEQRIVEDELWWKLRHWECFGKETAKASGRLEPKSGWLFNSILGKHADAMDNFPEPNVLAREPSDEKAAEAVGAVLPVIYEQNDFEQTYSDAWWYKLKHGTAAYGAFWDRSLRDGRGDIRVTRLDLLNIYWEPGISDIQDSQELFIVSMRPTDQLEANYPQLAGRGSGVPEAGRWAWEGRDESEGKTLVIDRYYRRTRPDGSVALHFCKIARDTLLYATENDPLLAERGLYDHGRYPVVLDVLYPEEGTPVGFGVVAVAKDPQMYIDLLGRGILENALQASRVRYFAKKSAGVNREQFLDLNEPIVDVEGDIDEEKLRQITVSTLPQIYVNIMQMKVDELKETSANRDFSQGSVSGGVTAAAAISALQEAGSKTSRDMIAASYRSYVSLCGLIIELVRQFYDEPRWFRVAGAEGGRFIEFSNALMGRSPVFDVYVRPQKRSAYTKLAQNELARELYSLGFFKPELASQALAALELMEFDGKEKAADVIAKNAARYAAQTAAATAVAAQQKNVDGQMQI